MNEKEIVVDVTTLLKWNRSPVGIIRTQLEFVSYILEKNNDVLFCRFNDTKDNIEIVDNALLKKVVVNLKNYKNYKNELQKKETETNEIIKEKERNIIYKALEYYQEYGALKLLIKICNKKCPLTIREPLRKLYRTLNKESMDIVSEETKKEKNKSFAEVLFAPEIYQSSQLRYDFLNENVIFISLGLDWDHSNYQLLYWLKKKYGFEFVGSFYDGIPIENPELVQSCYFSQKFFSHIYYLIHLSDRIFCISDFSKNQLFDICKKHNIKTIPQLKTIYLGDSIFKKENITNYPKREHRNNYVLYVSTIESRKNHVLLLKVWQLLQKESFKDLPDLVLVGMMGWGIDEFQKIYQSDVNLQKIIHLYHNVDDEELVTIYENAKFTVFPSFVEGWGLGAVESMLYGKPCIISNCDALQEATQGLMPSIDPKDIGRWVEAIKEFSSDDNMIKKYKKIIKTKFQSKSWSDFSKEFYEFAKEEK